MNSKISKKDKKDWKDFLNKNEKLEDKDSYNFREKKRKIFSFDLHGYSLEEANEKVKELIYYAYDNEISQLIIVTGKGLHSENEKDPYVSKKLGILKYSVPDYIKSNDELMKVIIEIRDAKLEDGGDGALYIFLKKKL